MTLNLALLAAMVVGCLSLNNAASPKLHLADEGGELNPQPLPPIAPEDPIVLQELFS